MAERRTNWGPPGHIITHPVRHRLIIFDADGTLRSCRIPGQPCPNNADEWDLLPNVERTLALYDWGVTAVSIASNQAGIAYGYIEGQTAYELLASCLIAATKHFPPIGSLFLCPHATDAGCACRKPQSGMLYAACNYWGCRGRVEGTIDCLMVGDMATDQDAALSASMDFIWAADFFGWKN